MSNNLPKLRFKGFTDEWKEQKLGDFLEFYSTNSLSRDCLNYKDGSIKNIHYGDIHMKFPVILDVNKHVIPFINDDIDTSKINKDSFCKDGDLIIADASEDYNDIGKAIEVENIGEDKVVAGLHTILARDTKKITARKFKGYMMLNEKVRKQIKVLAAGAKVLGISKSNLAKVSVKLPSLEEQERIANFLTKVDKIIEKQEEKVRNIENYKKGMMQKIFSQEIRFKDENGEEYPKWQQKKLGTLSKITTGKLDANAMEKFGKYRFYTCAREYYAINEYAFDTEALLISGNGANVGYIHYYKGKFNAYQRTYVLDQFRDNIQYVKYYLEKNLYIRILSEKKEGNTPYIVLATLSDMSIELPCSEEQTKIANFLSNIDGVIDKEKEKLNELRLWKKGLLQQMFV